MWDGIQIQPGLPLRRTGQVPPASNPAEGPGTGQVFLNNVTTDLTVGNILAFAQLAIGMDRRAM